MKRTPAQRLLDQLEAENCEWLLHQFEFCCAAHKAESRHPVWLGGAHPQATVGDAMMEQKLVYLHNNPVKRGLVASPEH